MFSKTALTFLALGALYVSALSVPVAREPSPEPECEFPRSFLTMSCHDLTLISLNSPRSRGPGEPQGRREGAPGYRSGWISGPPPREGQARDFGRAVFART